MTQTQLVETAGTVTTYSGDFATVGDYTTIRGIGFGTEYNGATPADIAEFVTIQCENVAFSYGVVKRTYRVVGTATGGTITILGVEYAITDNAFDIEIVVQLESERSSATTSGTVTVSCDGVSTLAILLVDQIVEYDESLGVNIASEATINYTHGDLGNLDAQGTPSMMVDGSYDLTSGIYSSGFGWAVNREGDTSSGGVYLFKDIFFEFDSQKSLKSVVLMVNSGATVGEDDYMYSDCIVSYWDGTEYVDLGSVVNQEVRYAETTTFAAEVQTQKIRVRVNLQFYTIFNFPAGWSLWYFLEEVQIFADSRVVSVDVSPFRVKAEISSPSKVKIGINGEVFGFPLVDTASATASPLRIFDGNQVKAFQLA